MARSILLTGASSGIGRALALAYAAPDMRLALVGRNAERLAAVAKAAEAKGATVVIGQVDVRDREAMASWIAAQERVQPFDLVIANAGITSGLGPDQLFEDPDAVRALLATNLMGVLNTVEPLIASMTARGSGHVAFVGSIAGLRGLQYSPAYCAAKAAIQAYTESIRARIEQRGVTISLILPGFVKTPLNDSITAYKPLEFSEDEAAAIIRRGLDRRRALIAFPRTLYILALLSRGLPARLLDRIMMRFHVAVPSTRERVGPS